MKPIQIISQDLFDKVRSRFSNLEMGDENGAVTIDPAQARFFDFDFVIEGNNLGRVSISINDLGSLKVYYSQGITENQDDPAKKEWFGFLKEMRKFAMRRLLRFDTRDIAKTNLDKNDFQHLATTQGPKEEEDMTTMNESRWNQKSTKKTSRAVKGQTEVIVRHSRAVDEMYPGARSQRKNIKAIFIQNSDGERFKYPFIHPAGAFAMAQHIDHGGVPHDPAGKAIVRMSEDIAKLQEFQRKIHSATLHDDAMGISERAIGRLNELKAQIEALGKRHQYECWMGEFQDRGDEGLMELDPVTMEEYKSKFTQTSFQEELASYFPLLHRIMSETNKIDLEDYVGESSNEKDLPWDDEEDKSNFKKPTNPNRTPRDTAKALAQKGLEKAKSPAESIDAFTEWAEAVEQGRLTDDQIESLKTALEQQEQSGNRLELGPNGSTAWDFFCGAVNPDNAGQGPEFSDDLKHKLEVAAEEFPDTDALEVFQTWAREDYPELLTALGMSAPEQEPEAAPQQDQAPEEQPAEENEEMGGHANDTMTREGVIKEVAKIVKSFYNRDNPEVGPFRGSEGIALDVKKQISEKFGEEIGEQAQEMAGMFMEKLSQEWEQRHGRVEDDGMARLKELLNRVKGKVESIGDVGGHPGKNIMPAEEDAPAKGDDIADKAWLKTAGEKPTVASKVKDAAKGIGQFFRGEKETGDTYESVVAEMRRLSGLAK